MRFPLLNSKYWLHADIKIIHARMTNYIHRNNIDLTERLEIEWKWAKIKDTMDGALKEMDHLVLSRQNISQTPHKSAKNQLE